MSDDDVDLTGGMDEATQQRIARELHEGSVPARLERIEQQQATILSTLSIILALLEEASPEDEDDPGLDLDGNANGRARELDTPL